MRLWIDDLREAPEGWEWAVSSRYAINLLTWTKALGKRVETISFDHDLGGDDTTRPVVLLMCQNDFWPDKCLVHTMNNVGRDWLIGTIERYAPHGTLIR